jgi:hypothetical protein
MEQILAILFLLIWIGLFIKESAASAGFILDLGASLFLTMSIFLFGFVFVSLIGIALVGIPK